MPKTKTSRSKPTALPYLKAKQWLEHLMGISS